MSRVIYIFIFCLAVTSQYGQTSQDSLNTKEDKKFWEISLNVSRFINNYLKFNDLAFTENSPYSFTADYTENGVDFIRMGIRMDYTKTEEDFSVVIPTNTKRSFTSFRVGYLRKTELSKRWALGVGGDTFFSYEREKFESNNNLTITSTTVGMELVFVINFQITERFKIWTQTGFPLTYSNNSTESDFGNPSETSVNFVQFRHDPALSIFAGFKF